MINTVFTSAAILAMSAVVQGVGRAVVVNQCSETVSLDDVPASGGGQSPISQSLSSGGSWSQQYTELTNGQGWSIKLAPGSTGGSIVQYEYTYHNDGLIWYDISAVNGDPFDGNWFISASDGCNPKQTSYRYPSDNANGMQDACSDSATITLTLCPGGSGGSGGSAPAAGQSAPAAGPSAPAAGPSAPAAGPSPPVNSSPATSPSQTAGPDRPDRPDHEHSPAETSQAPTQTPSPWVPTPSVAAIPATSMNADKFEEGGLPTTLATKVVGAAQTVTNVQTVVYTQFVTVSPVPAANKRSEHLHRHAEHHNHF